MSEEGQREAWQAYLAWNEAIAERIFPVGKDGQPVYLQLDDEDLQEIAKAVGEEGDPLHTFRIAVRRTLNLTDNGGIFERHARAAKRWKAENKGTDNPETPPCLGLLAVFVLAAVRMHTGEGLGGNNYYDRLLQELEVPEVFRPALRDHISAQFRRHSPRFWDALKRWLEGWEGSRGIFTAMRVGGYTYVGVPISQALVRSQDRSHLHELFTQRGYRPEVPPRREVLIDHLDRWIHQPGSPASKALRDIWDKGQREAIADIVAQELAVWEGPSEEDAPPPRWPSYGISLAIQFERRGLREVPTLLMLVKQPETAHPAPSYALELGERDEEDAPEVAPGFELKNVPLQGWYALEPSEEVVGSMGLLSELTFEAPELGIRLARSPRPFLPLLWSEAEGLYVEVSQLGREGRYLVLCREQWAEEVGGLLSHITQGEVQELGAGKGDIPEDWVLFTHVLPARWEAPPGLDTSGLTDLIPQPDHIFQVKGGLPLPGARVWHALRPPDILAVSEDEGARLKITCETRWRPGGEGGEERILAEGGSVVPIDHKTLRKELGEGQYRIELLESLDQGEWERAEGTTIHLRSANHPREVPANQSHPLGLPLEHRGARSSLAGLELDHEEGQGRVAVGARLFEDLDRALSAHPGGPGILEPLESPPSQLDWLKGSPTDGIGDRDYDLLLDALSFARAGGWDGFLESAGRVHPGYRFAYQAADRLSGLGHIEVGRAAHNMRPTSWSIAPPALVVSPEAELGYLAGFRSEALVEVLEEIVEDLDGCLEREQPPGGPSVIRALGLDPEHLELAASEASRRLGMEVGSVRGAPEALLAASPGLPEILQALPELNLPDPNALDVFDVGRGGWRRCSDRLKPGAYRRRASPRIYGVLTQEDLERGRLRAADPSLAMLLGYALAGRKLVSWERDEGRLRSLRGLALPYPIERGLVLCSGFPPRREGSQRTYRDIPPSIGDRVKQLMSLPTEG